MKTYKGWEILKMTEEGKFKEGDKIKNGIDMYTFDCGAWEDEDEEEAYISEFLKEEFEIIQKPVSFMEALNSDKKIKVHHKFVANFDDFKQFKNFQKLLEDLINYFSEEELKEIISNGKWYAEED